MNIALVVIGVCMLFVASRYEIKSKGGVKIPWHLSLIPVVFILAGTTLVIFGAILYGY